MKGQCLPTQPCSGGKGSRWHLLTRERGVSCFDDDPPLRRIRMQRPYDNHGPPPSGFTWEEGGAKSGFSGLQKSICHVGVSIPSASCTARNPRQVCARARWLTSPAAAGHDVTGPGHARRSPSLFRTSCRSPGGPRRRDAARRQEVAVRCAPQKTWPRPPPPRGFRPGTAPRGRVSENSCGSLRRSPDSRTR